MTVSFDDPLKVSFVNYTIFSLRLRWRFNLSWSRRWKRKTSRATGRHRRRKSRWSQLGRWKTTCSRINRSESSSFHLITFCNEHFRFTGRHKRSRHAGATDDDSYDTFRCCYSRHSNVATATRPSHAWISARHQQNSANNLEPRRSADDGR